MSRKRAKASANFRRCGKDERRQFRLYVSIGNSGKGVPTENSESGEKSRVLRRAAVMSPACYKLERSIVSLLARRFRSRAVVELENLALRHQLHVLRRQRPGRLRLFAIDRLLWVLLYRLWPRCLEAMVLVKPATVIQWHRQGFRLFWRWRSQIRATVSGARDSRSDSADEQRQPAVGCAPDPRRAAQARHRGQPSYGREVHGAKTGNTFSELAELSAESRRRHRRYRHVRCRRPHRFGCSTS